MWRTISAAWLVLCAAFSAHGAEVGGVQIADTVRIGATDVMLNGAGIRTRAIFKVYVGALYLPEKKSVAAEVLVIKGPKRIALHMLRDLSSEQLGGALSDGLAANLTEAEGARFKSQIDELRATMDAVGAAKEKSVVTLDFVPEAGIRIALDGVPKGKPIAGEDFYRALLKIWLGEKPVERSLKAAMLGQPN